VTIHIEAQGRTIYSNTKSFLGHDNHYAAIVDGKVYDSAFGGPVDYDAWKSDIIIFSPIDGSTSPATPMVIDASVESYQRARMPQ
jgi:hypothetical protein